MRKYSKVKMMVVFVLIFFIGGCVTTSSIPGPDNKQAFVIECGTMALSACYNEAAARCPNGYSLISSQPTYNANSITVQCK